MDKLSLYIGMFQILILKLTQRKNFLCSHAPRSQAACLELHCLACRSRTGTLALLLKSFGLWGGQMELWARWSPLEPLPAAGIIGWKAELGGGSEGTAQQGWIPHPPSLHPHLPPQQKTPNAPKPVRGYSKLSYCDLNMRREWWAPSHFLMWLFFRKVSVTGGLSFSSMTKPGVFNMSL